MLGKNQIMPPRLIVQGKAKSAKGNGAFGIAGIPLGVCTGSCK